MNCIVSSVFQRLRPFRPVLLFNQVSIKILVQSGDVGSRARYIFLVILLWWNHQKVGQT